MNKQEYKENLGSYHLVEKIYRDAEKENPNLTQILGHRRRSLIRTGLTEIAELEAASTHPPIPQSSDEAKQIKWIWDFSGPGYYDQPFKEDRYKDKPWAAYMDKRRIDKAAWFMRKVAEVSLGESIAGMDISDQREILKANAPMLIYNGRTDENEVVLSQLEREDLIIPKERVFVLDRSIDNTVDQIQGFEFPQEYVPTEGDRGVLVSHAPHLMRVFHMLEATDSFPRGLDLLVLPLGTPKTAGTQYAEDEVRGLLYYTYIRGVSSEQAYPYSLK